MGREMRYVKMTHVLLLPVLGLLIVLSFYIELVLHIA